MDYAKMNEHRLDAWEDDWQSYLNRRNTPVTRSQQSREVETKTKAKNNDLDTQHGG